GIETRSPDSGYLPAHTEWRGHSAANPETQSRASHPRPHLRGLRASDPRVSDLIMDGYKRHRVDPDAARVPKLSPREREVVQLVSEGKASKEVATILNVTLATAETHRSNIMRKLKLHSIAELVLYAVRNQII